MTETNQDRTSVDAATPQGDPVLANPDLAPTTPEDRNWGAGSFIAVWMGIAHNVNQWILVASMLALGMSFWQATGAVLLSFAIVYVATILSGTIGTRFGLAFPPIARAVFGRQGSYVPIILRATSGVLQLGVFVYVTGEGLANFLDIVVPGLKGLAQYHIVGISGDVAIAYVIAFLLHAYIATHGIERIRRFELWGGPLIMVVAAGLFVWALVAAHGITPIVSVPSSIASGEFWPIFLVSVAGLIGSMSSLIVNNPDIARFARSQKAQFIGQGIGIPVMFVVFSLITIVATLGTKFAFGHIINDPLKILNHFSEHPALVAFGSLCIAASTLSLNAATNAVSAGFDFTGLFPKLLNFRRAVTISLFIGVVSVPWLWYGNAHITTILYGTLGVGMGPVLGALLADFYLIRKRHIDVDALLRGAAPYNYRAGWNTRAIAALTIGVLIAVIGLLIPAVRVLYQFNWFLGVAGAIIAYTALMWPARAIDDNGLKHDVGQSSRGRAPDPS